MEKWIRATALNEIIEGQPFLAVLNNLDITLYRVKDSVYATEDLCSHAEASLSEGEQIGFLITCPRHGGQFDIRTGKAKHYPAFSPIRTYPVKVEDGSVFVDLSDYK